MEKPTRREELPLHPQVVFESFDKWGLDFIEPIDSPSNQNHNILICTNYLTKWVEVKSLRNANEEAIAKFLNEDIFNIFGAPRGLVKDIETNLSSNMI